MEWKNRWSLDPILRMNMPQYLSTVHFLTETAHGWVSTVVCCVQRATLQEFDSGTHNKYLYESCLIYIFNQKQHMIVSISFHDFHTILFFDRYSTRWSIYCEIHVLFSTFYLYRATFRCILHRNTCYFTYRDTILFLDSVLLVRTVETISISLIEVLKQ